jgi:single-strand DNA-binding protein
MAHMEKTEKRSGLPTQSVVVVGAVTESDLRYTPGGLAVLRLSLAGEWGEPKRVFYLTAKAFGAQAERLADGIQAGEGAVVVGRFTTRKGKEGREEMELVASRVELFPLPEGALAAPDAKGKRRMLGGTSRMWALGNLARVEFGYGPTGTPYVRGAVALHEGEETHFLPFSAFREAALALEGAEKGDRVYLEGALLHDSWQDREGKNRYGLRLEAERALHLRKLSGQEKAQAPAAEELEDFPEELPF